MARSAQSELREIAKLEEAARRDLERAQNRRAQLVAPLTGKLTSIFSERVREFLEGNIERAVAAKLDRKAFGEAVDEMLTVFFAVEDPDRSGGDNEGSRP